MLGWRASYGRDSPCLWLDQILHRYSLLCSWRLVAYRTKAQGGYIPTYVFFAPGAKFDKKRAWSEAPLVMLLRGVHERLTLCQWLLSTKSRTIADGYGFWAFHMPHLRSATFDIFVLYQLAKFASVGGYWSRGAPRKIESMRYQIHEHLTQSPIHLIEPG